MRIAACLTLGFALSQDVLAQAPQSPSPQAQARSKLLAERDEWIRRERIIWEVNDRALEMAPRRRDEPLRELNISDYEVREIQYLLREYLPKVIVNIGPVVTGCPCEEGRGCTEQVYVTANTTTDSKSMLLSRVNRRWDVSKAQKWYLRWLALKREEGKLSFEEFRDRSWALARDFPACIPDTATPAKMPAQPSAEPRK